VALSKVLKTAFMLAEEKTGPFVGMNDWVLSKHDAYVHWLTLFNLRRSFYFFFSDLIIITLFSALSGFPGLILFLYSSYFVCQFVIVSV
jgi:hypothetical protein